MDCYLEHFSPLDVGIDVRTGLGEVPHTSFTN